LPKKHISSEYVRNAAAERVDCPTSASMAGRAPVPTSKKAALTATLPRYSSFVYSGDRLRLPLPAPAKPPMPGRNAELGPQTFSARPQQPTTFNRV